MLVSELIDSATRREKRGSSGERELGLIMRLASEYVGQTCAPRLRITSRRRSAPSRWAGSDSTPGSSTGSLPDSTGGTHSMLGVTGIPAKAVGRTAGGAIRTPTYACEACSYSREATEREGYPLAVVSWVTSRPTWRQLGLQALTQKYKPPMIQLLAPKESDQRRRENYG